MLKAKATAIKRLVLWGALVAGAAALFGFAAPAWQTWREDAALRDAHISYVQFPCTTMTTAADCPSYRIDAFGDGTVVYQGGAGTKVQGSYIYRVSDEDLRAYIRDLQVSSFWSQAMPAGPNRIGGSCLITLHVKKEVRRNGCLKWKPGSDQAMDDASVSDSVAQLEALTRVNSLARGDAGTEEVKRHIRPFKPKKNTF
ncbi:hypothetical protein ABAC460_12100 [Asticcacaulis sp. AC460]|uniref:DUF6438 domain-containing protein n=1 Tax=Asticcacaulis sp. AC460 TaxID=1282360 RepID=UPI0003C40017|nr:DUF6438 domain-containing protein [Asticcacaulis sp. AC460]ESQ89604.1 hypothetical protein ABAC460_12100 [Asticcacaulis sp. AC460]